MSNTPTETESPPAPRPDPAAVRLPPQDVRRKRPPALSFLLRMETLRKGLRFATLLAVDFAGIFAALFTALLLKAVVQGRPDAWTAAYDETADTIAFAYLITALLF